MLQSKAKDVIIERDSRIYIPVIKEHLRDVMKIIKSLDTYIHLSTITANDADSNIEIIYHIVCKEALISLKTLISKNNPFIQTVTDLIPGAILYEREIHDLFGINFEGNPDQTRLLLPDRWPENVFPLRKWWTIERIKNKIGEKR